MNHQQVEKKQSNLYGVIGELSFESVVRVEKEGMLAIDEVAGSLIFDLAAVSNCSSAALALVLSWVRYAKQQGKQLIFRGIPGHLQALLAGSHVDELIVIESVGEP